MISASTYQCARTEAQLLQSYFDVRWWETELTAEEAFNAARVSLINSYRLRISALESMSFRFFADLYIPWASPETTGPKFNSDETEGKHTEEPFTKEADRG